MFHHFFQFYNPISLTKAAPAGYASLSIDQLAKELNSLLDEIKYQVNTEKFKHDLFEHHNACASILALLNKKLYALIGAEYTNTKIYNQHLKYIKNKINDLLQINADEKTTETRAAQIKKIHEIINACELLTQAVQQAIEKINFFPPMKKSELIVLIRELDAKKSLLDISELPIVLLKKYLGSKKFIHLAANATIHSQLLIDFLNKEDRTKLYRYYSDNAILPEEHQSIIYKCLILGINEAFYKRKLISDENLDRLTSRLPVEIWDYSLQFLDKKDLMQLKCSVTFFRDLIARYDLNNTVRKDYALMIANKVAATEIFSTVGFYKLSHTVINENLLAVAYGSTIDIVKLNAPEDRPTTISSITIPDSRGRPVKIDQLTVAKNKKILAVFISVGKSTFGKSNCIHIYDLLANNELALRTIIQAKNVCEPSLSHDGQLLIYKRFNKASHYVSGNSELVFYDLTSNSELNAIATSIAASILTIIITANKKVISIHDGLYHQYLRIWDQHAQCLYNINMKDIANIHSLKRDTILLALPSDKVALLHLGHMYVFDLTNGKMSNEITFKTGDKVEMIEKALLLPDGKIAMVMHNQSEYYNFLSSKFRYSCSLAILDPASQTLLSNTSLPLRIIESMVLAEDGNIIVTGKSDGCYLNAPILSATCQFAELACAAKLNDESKEDEVSITLPRTK